jgi:hypothetical protein
METFIFDSPDDFKSALMMLGSPFETSRIIERAGAKMLIDVNADKAIPRPMPVLQCEVARKCMETHTVEHWRRRSKQWNRDFAEWEANRW